MKFHPKYVDIKKSRDPLENHLLLTLKMTVVLPRMSVTSG